MKLKWIYFGIIGIVFFEGIFSYVMYLGIRDWILYQFFSSIMLSLMIFSVGNLMMWIIVYTAYPLHKQQITRDVK